MALLSACMHHVPCGTATDLTVSRRRWQAVVAHLINRKVAATARGSSCGASRQHDLDPSHGQRMQQGTSARWHTDNKAAAVDQRAEPAPSQQAASPPGRGVHNYFQTRKFSVPSTVKRYAQPPDQDTQEKLQRTVDAAPDLGSASRVIDVGCGAGVLIPYLQARGVRDILAVDLAQPMLKALAKRHPPPGTLGNTPGVRTWCGDIVDLPAAQGSADAAFFNNCFANVHDQHEALWAACRLLRPGGHIIISHPLGRDRVPRSLPDVDETRHLIHDLPLRSADVGVGPDDMYLRVLQVPEGYVFDNMYFKWQLVRRGLGPWEHQGFRLRFKPQPIHWKAEVVRGFGRGSRDLGFPTANLDPQQCRTRLEYQCFDLAGDPRADAITPRLWQMPNGVYFGFAKLANLRKFSKYGLTEADCEVHGMVMNIGERPTMADGGGVTVEVHVFDHKFSSDFYGRSMSVQICGYLRPEMKFSSLPALVAQIRCDIGMARAQLAAPRPQKWKATRWFPGSTKHSSERRAQLEQQAALQQRTAAD